MRISLATLLLAAATCYCSEGNAARGADLQQPVSPEGQQPVTATRFASGSDPLTYNSGMTEPIRLVVRDAATWSETWKRIWSAQPAPPVPAVDFNREMVIVAGLGTRSSGGHGITVESAYREGATLYIVVRTETPGSSCLLSAALTSPVDVARVPRTSDDVQFRERSVTRSC